MTALAELIANAGMDARHSEYMKKLMSMMTVIQPPPGALEDAVAGIAAVTGGEGIAPEPSGSESVAADGCPATDAEDAIATASAASTEAAPVSSDAALAGASAEAEAPAGTETAAPPAPSDVEPAADRAAAKAKAVAPTAKAAAKATAAKSAPPAKRARK